MKLVSFRAEGSDRIGLVTADEKISDLAQAAVAFGIDVLTGFPANMIALIEAGSDTHAALSRLNAALQDDPQRVRLFERSEIVLHPPVRRPSKICCLALNNSANADRIISGPKHPAIFTKPSSALIGDLGALQVREEYGRVHPEPELAVVIGKEARDVAASDALDYVFGYTIHNDFTSPTMRGEDTFHYRAIHPKADDPSTVEYVDTWVSYPGRYKSSDTFSALGPWLVTRDEITDPHDLTVQCFHQGRLVTEDNTENLFYKVAQVIEFASFYMTLLPGDVISMGTALRRSNGGMAVQNVDLAKLGGPVSVSIQGLGTLTTAVEHRS
ncbi:fumarylacetoacetate hydrolase [Paraburkholderia acidicola]|uniref:Fumarylacetoacetate hydrolase n=1 Tax=Paraburkholderia acidicola TaxID=1912599 RepID=A0A2A4EYV7_9BURK|nr:fumarylacetoacetate hydrolase family protein [Paraburkholderia acidicola]PCE25269.1 fumarylacetoacetate hydrolase [Paraburkholderia acidicola]